MFNKVSTERLLIFYKLFKLQLDTRVRYFYLVIKITEAHIDSMQHYILHMYVYVYIVTQIYVYNVNIAYTSIIKEYKY